ncbi:MAG: undecaprenyl-diphosphate phosphatase, partial [candidate division WOR-3 bacterium]
IKIVILIGIAQAIGLLPGISRSGATIGIALLLGINPTEAFEFSFLLSIPAVIGANILVMKDFTNTGISFLLMTIGIVVTAVTGFLALLVLRSLVLQKRFYYFGFYCVLVGILALIIF